MATSPPLATVADLAAFLREDYADDDASANLALEVASDAVRSYLGYDVTQNAATVTLDPVNGSFIVLPEHPVVQVSLAEILQDGVWVSLTPDQYTVSRRLGIIAGLPGLGISWPATPESWRITYTYGYDPVPDALRGVVLGVAARWLSNPAGLKTERLGGYISTFSPEAGFTPMETHILRRFALPVIA